tara:strand:+ start:1684 stop:3729 length:2046 start_codon:yes stop_codon:yes gene_type:complete
VALKKPSDFFGNTKKTPLDEIKEEYTSASPQKIEQVSEAFDSFKNNLEHIQSLSDFTNTFDSFRNNLEKVESVTEEITLIREDLKDLIKKEDLDSAMMAQLLFVQESISRIDLRISSINGETVDKIKEDFVDLSNTVGSFLDIDVPKYKKLISESEVRVDSRFTDLKDQVEENLDTIRADVNKEVTTVLADVETLNQNTFNTVKEEFKENVKDVKKTVKTVSSLVEEELPKYKKLFAETEVRTEERVKTAIDSYQETIVNLQNTVKEFTENEIPKYNSLLIENKIKSEKEVKELEEQVLSKVGNLTEKIESISSGIHEKTEEKIVELKTVVEDYKGEIDSISKTYDNLYKDFKKREISENEKLETYSDEIKKYHKRFDFLEEAVTEDLREIQSVLIQSNENYHSSLKTEVSKFRNKISEQMSDLQVDLVVNEKHIKKQNESIEEVQNELKIVLEKLQMSSIEEKSNSLMEKIVNLEQILLKEDNPTLPGDPSTNNSADPLTPLDQKFVTLDQLQNHYRLFINRIQQQIATIGGGGIEDAPNDGQDYVRNSRKWVVSTGGGGKFADDSVGIHTTSNVGLGTTARSDSTLYVDGSATITGDLNISGDLVYDEANARNWNVSGIATVGTAFYMPQYTTTARDAATFNEGAMIFNTTTKKMEFYDGTNWQSLPGMTLGLTVALDG